MRYFAIIAALLLSGCQSYWIPDTSVANEVKAIHYVAAPCGDPKLAGCYWTKLGVIEIRAGMDAWSTECAIKHERRHAAGYRHEDGWKLARMNCGDADYL